MGPCGAQKNDPTIDVKMATAKALVTQKGGSLICHAQSEGDRWDLLNDQTLAPCSENVECPHVDRQLRHRRSPLISPTRNSSPEPAAN